MWILRRGVLAALFLSCVAVAPATAVPITVTQSVTVGQIAPFPGLTGMTLTSTAWSANPFPFTQASQISQIRIWFDSADADYVDGIGPNNGSTWAAIYAITDPPAPVQVPMASVDHAAPSIFLAAAQGPTFTILRNLIADGQITFAVAAYEAFPDHSGGLILNGPSTLRVEITGDAPAPVPEPASMVLLGSGLLIALCVTRRTAPRLSRL
jgi:hypothetical protein